MRYLSEIFWRHSWDVGTPFPNIFEFLVCLSVCKVVYFLTDIRQIYRYFLFCSGWDIFLIFFETFLRCFYTILKFLQISCMSVSPLVGLLTCLLKLGQYRDISCSGWDICQKFLGDIPGFFLHYFQKNANCLYVCQSVGWLTSLQLLDEYRHIFCPDWDIFLNFFWDISGMFLN